MRSWPVVYPAIFAVVWVLMLYVATSVSPYAALRVLVVAFLAGLLASWLGSIVLRDRDRGAFLGLLVVVLIVYGDRLVILALVALATLILVLAGHLTATGRGRFRWPLMTRVLTGVCVVLLIAVGIKAIQTGAVSATISDLVADRPILRSAEHGPAPADAPDIFLIMLDSYARHDQLADRFGVDDGPFLRELEARGFQVAPASRSNYLLTQLTLASMLNMAHLDDLDGPVGYTSSDVELHRGSRALINRNEVFDRLREQGYDITSIASGWEDVAIRQADRYIDTGPLNEFELISVRSTALWPLLDAVTPQLLIDAGRARIERSVERFIEVAGEPGDAPRLVMAHLSAPHPPFVLGSINEHPGDLAQAANYEITGDAPMTEAQYAERYAAQVNAVDDLVVDTVDRLDAVIDPGSIVIVMSDHGSRSTVDWADLQPSDLDERSANLFAARTPGHPDLFGASPTPVNLFGTLLGAYLGIDVPRTPDATYYWDGSSPFDTVPVDDLPPPSAVPD
jgi:hypothetical protein